MTTKANPHVHISVRAESKHGRRLNPRKTDLHRWRETFAEKLGERGIEAEATRQATRGTPRRYTALWQIKATEDGRLLRTSATARRAAANPESRDAAEAWHELAEALASTGSVVDRQLANSIKRFAAGSLQAKQDVAREINSNREPTDVGPVR